MVVMKKLSLILFIILGVLFGIFFKDKFGIILISSLFLILGAISYLTLTIDKKSKIMFYIMFFINLPGLLFMFLYFIKNSSNIGLFGLFAILPFIISTLIFIFWFIIKIILKLFLKKKI